MVSGACLALLRVERNQDLFALAASALTHAWSVPDFESLIHAAATKLL